jgi:hypothetical protein
VVLEIDHIIPVSSGGNNHDSNLITACVDCNRGKAGSSIEDRRFSVIRSDDGVSVMDAIQRVSLGISDVYAEILGSLGCHYHETGDWVVKESSIMALRKLTDEAWAILDLAYSAGVGPAPELDDEP